MHEVIAAAEMFKGQNTVYYCTEFNPDEEKLPSTQIFVYDLDNDGILRIGKPGDPYMSNLYFNDSKVEYERLNAFYTLEEAKKYSDRVLRITMNKNYVVVNKELITPAVKVAK